MESRPRTPPEPFGARIRRLRKRLGLSPAELARRAQIAPADLLRLERGDQRVGFDSLTRLLAILMPPEGPASGPTVKAGGPGASSGGTG
ncbi:MAG: helix-turn-helix transcriptional regulator [Acidobacteriota bacterium]|nr:helix-turn-helix transcriptional regulator [Acidobacteriota bacterium]